MSYDSTILAESGLLAFYPLNDTSGTTATDASSNGYSGTINGTVTLNQSKIASGLDSCMLFDGNTGYISLPTWVNVGEPFSIELWMQGQSGIGNSMFYSNNTTAGVEFGWNHSSSDQCFVAGHGGNFDSSNAFATGATYYVELEVDTSNNYTVYAGKVGTDSAPLQWGTGNPGGGPTYSGNSHIGSASDNTEHFAGYISSVAIYNKLLGSTIRNNHYTTGISGGNVPLNLTDSATATEILSLRPAISGSTLSAVIDSLVLSSSLNLSGYPLSAGSLSFASPSSALIPMIWRTRNMAITWHTRDMTTIWRTRG